MASPKIHLYFTQFAAPDAMSATESKEQARALVVLEKRASRALQGHALAQVLGIPIDAVRIEPQPGASSSGEYETRQQSALSRKPWHRGAQFNTTNEGGTVVVAVAKGEAVPLGVDLVAEHHCEDAQKARFAAESTDFDTLDLEYVEAMVLTPGEIKAIQRVKSRRARQRVYAAAIALKEAFLKYHGVGLVGVSSLADVEVAFPEDVGKREWVCEAGTGEASTPALEWVCGGLELAAASALRVDYVGDRVSEDSGAAGQVFRVVPVRGTTELVGAVVGPRGVLSAPEQSPVEYEQHHVAFSRLL